MAKFNGYCNYPTYAISLWMDNDEGLHVETLAMARPYAGSDTVAAYKLGRELKEYFEELFFTPGPNDVHADLASWAWEIIEWYELAEELIHTVNEG